MKTHEKLEKLLKEKGRGSQARLAEYVGENKGFVNRWVKGKQTIPKSKLHQVAKFLGVSVDYLLDDSQEIPINRYIPVIGYASCGVPTNHFYDDAVEYMAAPSDIDPNTSYAVRAMGESMEPEIPDGSIAICDTKKPPSNNKIVHYTYDGESGLKRISRQSDGSILLIPDNKECEGCNIIHIPKERAKELHAVRVVSIYKPV